MKRKIVSISLVTVLLMLCYIGITVAYFTDTDTKTNTFTMGDVDITLKEEVPSSATNLTVGGTILPDDNATAAGADYANLLPSQQVYKRPYIVVEPTSADSYVAAKVTVDHRAVFNAKYPTAFGLFQVLFEGGLADNFDALITTGATISKTFASAAAVGYEYTHATAGNVFLMVNEDTANGLYEYYFVFETAQAASTTLPDLFDHVRIPDLLTQADTAAITAASKLAISVDAYAIQALGISDAFAGLAQFGVAAVSND